MLNASKIVCSLYYAAAGERLTSFSQPIIMKYMEEASL